MPIVDFILARIAEDEAAAHRALERSSPIHRRDPGADAQHSARWSPWRVESACIAKRLLMRAHKDDGPTVRRRHGHLPEVLAATCRTCHDEDGKRAAWPCYTLRAIATEWADHPDYRDDWTPDPPAIAPTG